MWWNLVRSFYEHVSKAHVALERLDSESVEFHTGEARNIIQDLERRQWIERGMRDRMVALLTHIEEELGRRWNAKIDAEMKAERQGRSII